MTPERRAELRRLAGRGLDEGWTMLAALPPDEVITLLDALDVAEASLEQERVRLAGCSVAAQGGATPAVVRGVYGWSPAFDDVRSLYERMRGAETRAEKAERERDGERGASDALRAEVERLRAAYELAAGCAIAALAPTVDDSSKGGG